MSFPSRYVDLEAARRRFGDRVDRLGPYLSDTDPLADALVERFTQLPPGQGSAQLALALERGIDEVADAPDELRALFADLDAVPPWVDWGAVDRGGSVLVSAGVLGGAVLGARSLVLGYCSPGGNKPLVFSGRLQEQALQRLNETSKFVYATCVPGGMRRHGQGFALTVRVRMIHAQVRRMILLSGRWDAARWGAPINQHDMVGTSMLFSLVLLDGLRSLGLEVDTEDAHRYMQLWRYSAKVIGIAPELIPGSEAEARSLWALVEMTQGEADDDSRALTRALLESPRRAARTAQERSRAETQIAIATGLCRALLGEQRADQLRLPRTYWRGTANLARALLLPTRRLRGTRPGRALTLRAGNRYWRRVLAQGSAEG
ncbi:MAG: oxygenase MpaB family protein [Polyangiaceae bacterium]